MKKVSPFDFRNYRDFLQERIASMPSHGHGQLVKIAKHLQVHPTLLTQILKKNKNLNSEHGLLIAEYFGLGDLETDLFLAFIELERAGHFKLKARVNARIANLKEQFDRPQSRVLKHKVLSGAESAIFYSNWYYSAIRLITAIEAGRSSELISSNLGLPRRIVRDVLEFLLKTGLILEKNGRYEPGPQRTYLPSDSPMVSRHHTNWRLKAIENFSKMTEDDLAFTAPISISREDFPKAREIFLKAIEQVSHLVEKSKQDTLACVNVDLFFVCKK